MVGKKERGGGGEVDLLFTDASHGAFAKGLRDVLVVVGEALVLFGVGEPALGPILRWLVEMSGEMRGCPVRRPADCLVC